MILSNGQYPPLATDTDAESEYTPAHDETQETTLDDTANSVVAAEDGAGELVIDESLDVKPKKATKRVADAVVPAKAPVASVVDSPTKVIKTHQKDEPETDSEVISRSGRKIKPKR